MSYGKIWNSRIAMVLVGMLALFISSSHEAYGYYYVPGTIQPGGRKTFRFYYLGDNLGAGAYGIRQGKGILRTGVMGGLNDLAHGTLLLQETDLSLPGRGGLDLRLTRALNSGAGIPLPSYHEDLAQPIPAGGWQYNAPFIREIIFHFPG